MEVAQGLYIIFQKEKMGSFAALCQELIEEKWVYVYDENVGQLLKTEGMWCVDFFQGLSMW